jgi:hypothetical protein
MNELAELFRNAIELNRYSNSVSRRIIESYNDRVLIRLKSSGRFSKN